VQKDFMQQLQKLKLKLQNLKLKLKLKQLSELEPSTLEPSSRNKQMLLAQEQKLLKMQ